MAFAADLFGNRFAGFADNDFLSSRHFFNEGLKVSHCLCNIGNIQGDNLHV